MQEILGQASIASSLTEAFDGADLFMHAVQFYLITSLDKEIVNKFSFSIEEMLMSCTFNYHACEVSDFEEIWTIEYGRCYKFNSKDNLLGNPQKMFFFSEKNTFYRRTIITDEL